MFNIKKVASPLDFNNIFSHPSKNFFIVTLLCASCQKFFISKHANSLNYLSIKSNNKILSCMKNLFGIFTRIIIYKRNIVNCFTTLFYKYFFIFSKLIDNNSFCYILTYFFDFATLIA